MHALSNQMMEKSVGEKSGHKQGFGKYGLIPAISFASPLALRRRDYGPPSCHSRT